MQFENTLTIRKPPEVVFQFLADFENAPSWNYAIERTQKASEGPVRVGTTYHQTRSIPAPSEETFTVTEFEPPRRLAIDGDLGPFRGTLSYDLESVSDGTRLTNRADLRGTGLAKVAGPLLGRRVGDAVAANLGKLKEILESTA
ncbi:MAG: SRPBCC family protein [Actinomycetota bacterium]